MQMVLLTNNISILNIINKIYNTKRLEDAIMSFDPFKAAGPDTLKPVIIQKAWHSIKDVTRDIMS